MFKYKRIILSVLFLLLLGLTWLFADHLVDETARTRPFWYLMGGIWAGELLLAVNIIFIPRSNDKALPFRMAEIAVDLLYLLFVFLMIVPFNNGVGPRGMFLWEAVGLLAALALHVLFGFAHRDTVSEDAAFRAAAAERNSYIDELERIRFAKRELLKADDAVGAAFAKLGDKVRFSADNTIQCPTCDGDIRSEIAALDAAQTPGDLRESVDKLLELFELRERMIKRSR